LLSTNKTDIKLKKQDDILDKDETMGNVQEPKKQVGSGVSVNLDFAIQQTALL
jgi:hypothetical protein